MTQRSAVTYLFSDIEGSTRLWETDPERAARALAMHDRMSRETVERHRGTVVKMTGDGLHAAFAEPADALAAVVDLQLALAEVEEGRTLKVRCGLHLGADERRDNDFFGPAVNRAARIMSAAHGGQVLLSRAVAERVANALPGGVALRELGEVRLRDLSSPEHVYQVVHPALRADFPALRSLASTPNNLPQQLNSFIDRQREMTELRELVIKNRLVTLLAMGGIGKSRLSIQLGAELLDQFPDGVWLIELAPVHDPANVPQAAAAVLGVKEDAGGGITRALERFVADRRLLLILDNCEHVVRAAAELAKRLLMAGPHVKVLASSRDALQIAGETVFHVPTLPVPEAGDAAPEMLTRHAAVQLFVDRASAAQPAFRLDERSAIAVGEVCRRLDGIPLALELAAARTRSLPIHTIAARLDQRFRLLTTADETVLPRQRTLRALIDWSHDLLGERERTAFRRLAVFAGGWTLDAAEAVIAGDDMSKDEVIDQLSSLVEKSLVAMEADTGRYRMLDTVRHYAGERLAESGDERATQARHCQYFLTLAERAYASLRQTHQSAALHELDAERDNLLAAFANTADVEDGDQRGFRFVVALRYYLIHRGMPTSIVGMCEELLARPGVAAQPLLKCRILSGAGQACVFMGRHASARKYLGEALSIARAQNDVARVGAVLQPLGAALVGEGDYEAARGCLDEAVQLATASGNEYELIAAQTARAMLHRLEGNAVEAERLYSAALAMARTSNNRESVAMCLLNLAMTQLLRGDAAACRPLVSEALDIAADTGSVQAQLSAIEVCAGLASAQQDWPRAARLFGFCEAQGERTGLRRDAADDAFFRAAVERTRASGTRDFEHAEAQGRTMSAADALREARATVEPRDGPRDR